MTTRQNGTIKRIVGAKGFGFLSADNGQEYFFHTSGCVDFGALKEGQAVTFVPSTGPKGPRAEDVRTDRGIHEG